MDDLPARVRAGIPPALRDGAVKAEMAKTDAIIRYAAKVKDWPTLPARVRACASAHFRPDRARVAQAMTPDEEAMDALLSFLAAIEALREQVRAGRELPEDSPFRPREAA